MRPTIAILTLLIAGGVALAMPVLTPVHAAEVPTTQALSDSSLVDDVLDALDARGKSLSDLSATVKLTDTDNATGDATSHLGQFILQKKSDTDARVKISFTKKEQGDKLYDQDHQYLLDNGKLTERDYRAKKQITRQVVKPGQQMNLLKLGEGPFPLPLGQKKEDVKAQFDVKKIDPAKDDPANTIHLQLTPGPGSTFAKRFKALDIWVDKSTAIPTRIQTLDRNETTIKTTDLTNVKTNSGVKDDDFVEPELPAGWETIDEPYGE